MTTNGPRRLIVHADDLGLGCSVNSATVSALISGHITSASIMAVAPCFDDAVQQVLQARRQLDIGVHLTVTSEWPNYKWGPLTRMTPDCGLIGSNGCFFPDIISRSIDIECLRNELCAQIERTIRAGITPTHIDSHMFALYRAPDLLRAYLAVAHQYALPALVPPSCRYDPGFSPVIDTADFRLRGVYQATPATGPGDWEDFYAEVAAAVKPGLSELLVHLGYDDQELRAITGVDTNWGSRWRQRDLDAMRAGLFRSALDANAVELVTWTNA
ncbi:MAG: ChbG/HpnK family deacetylase [Bryobacterales bacterium]|nr:ChbG/HpnK family deacetylase [Bryobacterales bacterium]